MTLQGYHLPVNTNSYEFEGGRVVMTISTYTEPVPVNPASEPPQISPIEREEIEEDNEPSEFAKLLAGLLAKSGMEEPIAAVQTAGIQGDKIETDVDVFAFEDTGVKIAQKEEPEGIDIPDEKYGVLLSAEHLLNRSDVPIENDTDTRADVLQTLSGFETEVDFAELEPVMDFAPLTETAAVQIAEDDLHAESDDKKDRSSFKIESVSAHDKDTRLNEELALLKNKETVKETPSRLDEARAKNRRDRVTFEVHDMRTGTETAKTAGGMETRLNASVETRMQSDAPLKEMTLELRLPDQAQNTAQTTWEAKAGNSLENMLARELHQNFNGDIVRHASMALRDGGEGTIRIALKPESLGNVKIRLEMAENKITGIIVVESEEALNAFKKEIASLEQAFRDSGFENADLNLSLTADGSNAQGQEQTESSFTPWTVALRYEDSADWSEDHWSVEADAVTLNKQGSINMFA